MYEKYERVWYQAYIKKFRRALTFPDDTAPLGWVPPGLLELQMPRLWRDSAVGNRQPVSSGVILPCVFVYWRLLQSYPLSMLWRMECALHYWHVLRLTAEARVHCATFLAPSVNGRRPRGPSVSKDWSQGTRGQDCAQGMGLPSFDVCVMYVRQSNSNALQKWSSDAFAIPLRSVTMLLQICIHLLQRRVWSWTDH